MMDKPEEFTMTWARLAHAEPPGGQARTPYRVEVPGTACKAGQVWMALAHGRTLVVLPYAAWWRRGRARALVLQEGDEPERPSVEARLPVH